VRIIFTAGDLGRVRLSHRWDPLAETVRSVRMLRRRELPWLNPWRTSTRSRIDSRMRPLLDLAPASQAPILNYPIPGELRIRAVGSGHGHHPGHLAALLGPTRARALNTIVVGCTTTELARQLGITPATASEHTAILRNTGLIITRRHRNNAVHTLTPLGHALLTTNPP
jgi:DNA-binding transcriptional ArsR family regulator